jgi:hypothetical protein
MSKALSNRNPKRTRLVYNTQDQTVVDEETSDVERSGIGKSEEGKDSAP